MPLPVTYANIWVLTIKKGCGPGRNYSSLKNGFLYEEPNFLLKDEVVSAVNYFSIIRVMVDRNHKLGKIVGALGTGTFALTPYLSALGDIGYVAKKTPITEKSRKGLQRPSFYF